jgi:hypothetical protein
MNLLVLFKLCKPIFIQTVDSVFHRDIIIIIIIILIIIIKKACPYVCFLNQFLVVLLYKLSEQKNTPFAN